ncbi:Uncharacterized conserved protein, DUF2267 family [Enhydrobacter aerosaccus]|uniref:Uncharacterized conserved protein, DUF2267 family n=1 Tax=Enhydrobacter aerosaccus TaxID=225324 RepID=A0A1T4SHK6_9HYPH|nr:DUF2267 domain-containing protein [Enhydrobacter aerosaccus]SKA27667.1 Uncharacterized conserved protein, DUF2267 family [Enhydrobacter aerosaccus]
MTVPQEYERASKEFEAFLVDVRDTALLSTTHRAYTMAQGVLQAFRRRLTVKEALLFANVLPVGLRALFVADWDIDAPKRPFADKAAMNAEVLQLRQDHNVSTQSAIEDVAAALRRRVDHSALEGVLARLPKGAAEFWRAD